MRNAGKPLLALGLVALVATALVLSVPATAGPNNEGPGAGLGGRSGGQRGLLEDCILPGFKRPVRDSSLSRRAAGPITSVDSVERLIQGSTYRASATVRDLRQVVLDSPGVEERDPAGFGRGRGGIPGMPPTFAQGGVIVSSDRVGPRGTEGVKADLDLWAFPLPAAGAGGVMRTDASRGRQLTATTGRNERMPRVDEINGRVAFVAENAPPDAPAPPAADQRQDHVFVLELATGTVSDATANFSRGDGPGQDPDGWDIHSITFDVVMRTVVFASDYGRPAGSYKLWSAPVPTGGGSSTASIFAPMPGMGTDAWIYDNPDYNYTGDLLFDSNRGIGGDARRIWGVLRGSLVQVTNGSKQVNPVPADQLIDRRPQWGHDAAGFGATSITFVSNRITGASDAIVDFNAWYLTDITVSDGVIEDHDVTRTINPDETNIRNSFVYDWFRLGPIDEITTSSDEPSYFSAMAAGGRNYAVEQINGLGGDGNVYAINYATDPLLAPAGASDQPIVNGGDKDLSTGAPLIVDADVRGFPVTSLGIEEANISQVYVAVWNPERNRPPRYSGAGPAIEHPWITFTPADVDGIRDEFPYEDSGGVDISIAYQMFNNWYTNASTLFYIEDVFPLAMVGPSTENPGFTRFSNASAPYDATGLSRSDKLIGIWIVGTCYAKGEVTPFEFLYDNISGFTTRPWQPTGNVLIVDDYMDGQLSIGLIQSSRGGGPFEEGSYEALGTPVGSWWGTQWSGTIWRDGQDIRRVDYFAPNDLVTANIHQPGSWSQAAPFDSLLADRWRIASRGRLPETVINRYLPELVPYAYSDPRLGDTPEEQYRGPFRVTVDANLRPTSRVPHTAYPGVRGVLWGAPYSGNLFVDVGTILDPESHAVIQQFVDQGGGILLSGMDIGWALTLDGIVQSPFLQNLFGVTYVRDDVGNFYGKVNGLSHDDPDLTAPGGRGRFPVNRTANPVAYPPATWWWWQSQDAGRDTDATPLRFPYVDTTDAGTNWYTEGAAYGTSWGMQSASYGGFQMEWPDVVQLVPPAGALAYGVAYNYGNEQGVAGTYVQHASTDPLLYWGGRTAYLAFNLESVSREYNQFSINNVNYVECLLKRNKLVQCFLDWGRTGTLEGYVTTGAGIPGVPAGTPLPNVLVVMYPMSGQETTPTVLGMLTDSNGYYKIRGLPVDAYRVIAYAPGLAADHQAAEYVWPDGTNREGSYEGFSMLLAPSGRISGTVLDADIRDAEGNLIPLEGIQVVARATDAQGNDYLDPVTSRAIERSAMTDAQGRYIIDRVPSGTTYRVTANPPPKTTQVQINHKTDDTTYAPGGSGGLVKVEPSTETTGVNFRLPAVPGNVRGLVYAATDGGGRTGIGGAVVRVVGAAPPISTNTDENGNYDFSREAPQDDPFRVPAGPQRIEASAPGYQTNTLPVEVVALATAVLDIPLTAVPPGSISGRVTASDGTTGVSGITIEAFFGTATTPTASAVSGPDGAYSIAAVPAGTYTVRARDTVYNRAFVPAAGRTVTVVSDETVTGVDFRIAPLHVWPTGVQMISTPYSYANSDVSEILGLTADQVKLAWWLPHLNRYAIYPEAEVTRFVRGRGYFAKFTSATEISRKGNTPESEFGVAYEHPLSDANGGWNMIGCPFPYEVDYVASTVLYNGAELTVPDAVGQGLVSGALYTYAQQTGQGGYDLTFAIEPYKGYWIQALKPGLALRLPAVPAGGSAAARSAGLRSAGVEWAMQLVVEVEDVRDAANYVGVAPDDAGYDPRHDIAEPPSTRAFAGREVRLYFPVTTQDGTPRMLSTDLRAGVRGAESWDFVVDTNVRNAQAILRWPDLRALPRTFSATLEDLGTGKSIAMRSATEYRFDSGDGLTPHRFKLTIRNLSGAGNPTPQVLGTDSMARGVTVSYRLQSDVEMTITVLNQAGRAVRTLVSAEQRSAGVHSEMWDGRDDGGRLLPAGEYRLELRAVADDGSIGRATVRAVR